MHSKFISINVTILGPAFSSVSSIPNFQHWPLARNSVPLKSGRRRCSRHRRRRRRRRRQPPPYFSPHSLLVSSVFRQVVVVLGRKKENTGHSIICENLAGALITLKFIQNVNSLLAPSWNDRQECSLYRLAKFSRKSLRFDPTTKGAQ